MSTDLSEQPVRAPADNPADGPPPIEPPADETPITDAPPTAPAPQPPLQKRFPCADCGAKLQFQPGTVNLQCPYCGTSNHIPQSEDEIIELDFQTHLTRLEEDSQTIEARVIKCGACGSSASHPEHAASVECPFCGSDIVATETAQRLVKPNAILPFHVTRDDATSSFHRWTASLWFAPSKLKKWAALESKLNGVYTPYWTYDSNTTSFYRGSRGDDHWTTVRRNGKNERVKKTRWTSVSGTVWNGFDDVLVLASRSLPPKHTSKLEPWDTQNVVPYANEYLSGFGAESYTIDLAEGFAAAKQIMDPTIRQTVNRDIGGDHQRISSLKTQYDDVTFKHLLLPIWISTYRYKGKAYRFLVNARTGEVQGERPWSPWKITSLVVTVVAIVGIGLLIFAITKGG